MAAELATQVLSACERGFDVENSQVDLVRDVYGSLITIAAGRDLRRRPHPLHRTEGPELLSASPWI